MSHLGTLKNSGKGYRQAFAAGLLSLMLVTGVASANGSHHPMRFDRISLDDGLSQSNVLSILQDSKGLMWFGTENGLNSYNGYEFGQYRRERGNPEALGSDFIYDLAEGSDGTLWVATNGGGLASMDRKTDAFTSYRHDPQNPNSIASNVVRTVMIDRQGVLWLGTRGAGLDRFDAAKQEFTHYRFGGSEDHAKNANEIHVVYEDTAGVVWVGSNLGLTALDAETGEAVTHTHNAEDTGSISDHRVRSILEDSRGNLWVGTYGGGLNRFDRDSGKFERFLHAEENTSSISSNRVTALFEDSDGRLWAGTSRGLNLVNRAAGKFIRYTHSDTDPSSLGDDAVTQIFQDRGGMLWVGTQNRGLSKWNPRSWSFGLENARQIVEEGDRQPNITSFVQDASGTLWVGTFGDGLNAVDRSSGDVKRYRYDASRSDSISDDRVMSLTLGNDGRFWVGTMTGGLNLFDPKTGSSLVFQHDATDPASLSSNGIMAVHQDSNGLVWVGTFGGGISRLDPETGKFTRFMSDPADSTSLSSNRVTSFAEDSNGMMWVGTDAGGLNLFDPRRGGLFHHFRHNAADPLTLASDTIYALTVDADGTVWIGTQGGGLDRVVGSADKPEQITFANVSQADGLANDVIYGIQIDDSGQLWLSSNYGISRFDPASGDIRNMHRRDGLQSEEFNFGAHFKNADGELFFGGHNGFNAFRPEAVQSNAVVPLLMLTGFFNGNSPVKSDIPADSGEGVDIAWSDDNISFEFAAMDYAAPTQNRYMYMLEGFDSEWIDLGNRRRVTYTDLDDGQYVLRVKAANADGVWNEKGFSMPVTVSPAPWDTWWAYLGYVALATLLASALWQGHQRKIRREEQYSRRLEEAVSERTEKLADRNSKLKKLNNVLQESSLSDPLTGLKNRRFVFEEVSRDLEVIRRKYSNELQGLDSADAADMVFMMIDLDHFKPINDTYGHAAGDQMLLEVRNVLLDSCRSSDFVIRWGGDEFVVIAKQAHGQESMQLAERIRSSIADRGFKLADGQVVHTTCSIGYAAYPLFNSQAEEADLEQVISLADNLMYEAKQKRNAWAGMMGIADAATSDTFDHDSIDSSSMLFRAKRAGNLTKYLPASTDDVEEVANVS